MRDHGLETGQQAQETTQNTFNFSLQNKILEKIEVLLNKFVKNPNFTTRLSFIYGDIKKFEILFKKLKNLIKALPLVDYIISKENDFGLDFVDDKLDLIYDNFDEISHIATPQSDFTITTAVGVKFSTTVNKLLQTNLMALKKYCAQLKISIFCLEDINVKIEKITNKDKDPEIGKDISSKMKKYLKSAADPEVGKIAKMRYLSQPKQVGFPYDIFSFTEFEEEILAINKFNKLFIDNCHYLLIAEEDQTTAINSLKTLQQSIISANCKLNNIEGLKRYGVLVVDKMINELNNKFICNNYATKVLLQDYFKSFAAIECIKYDSAFFLQCIEQYIDTLVTMHAEDSSLHQNLAIKHVSYIAHIFAYFDGKIFKKFLEEYEQSMRIFFKQIFTAFLKEFQKNKSLGNCTDGIIKNLLNYLVIFHNKHLLFELIKKELSAENYRTMQEILSLMFKDIPSYGIDFSDSVNVRNCFRPWFFHILINHQKSSILFDKFNTSLMQILFYVGIDDETVHVEKDNAERAEEFDELLANITAEFTYNEDSCDETTKTRLATLLESLKRFSGVGSFQARAIAARDGLNAALQLSLSKQDIEQHFIKSMLKLLGYSNFIYEKKIYKIMAELGLLQQLKEVKLFLDEEIVYKLKTANLNFSKYCDYLEKVGQPFEVNKDLNQDFNLPYHLSLSFDSKDMAPDDVGLMMLILYRIFGRPHQFSENNNEAAIQDLNYYFSEISKSAQRLLVFYNEAIVRAKKNHLEYPCVEECFNKLKQASLTAIIDGFAEQGSESLEERIDKARLIVDNAINYKIHFVEAVLIKELTTGVDVELKQQTIAKFFDEIQEILKTMLQRNGKNLQQWTNDTSSVGEKVAFLCAKYKYSESEFKEWLLKLNPNKEQDEIFKASLVEAEVVSKHVDINQFIFDKIDIKHLQYNQKFALSIIYQFLAKPKIENIFMQLGTGQGKSVVIAETARKIISDQLGKQVFIFTCYSHLATRDYQKFKPYFEHFGINSVCCSKDILTEAITQDLDVLINSKVIYANLESYFDLIRKERFKLLQGKRGLNFPDYKQAVLIMDEFDSLILDSDEIYQKIGNFSIGTASIEDMRNKPKIKKLLGEDFINKMNKLDPKLFDNWYDLEIFKLNSGYHPNSSESSLGISSNFVGSFLKYLSITGMGQFLFCYLDPLVFYREFKYMIGFSGSINKDGMKDLSDIFSGKENYYYEIPPFYGVKNLQQNRKFTNNPGRIVIEEKEFLNAVVAEVKEKKSQGRPVLLFADLKKNRNNNETSDFELIEKRLRQEEFLDHKQFNVIQEEKDIEKLPYIGKENAVTLASRILARGADIKVDGHIKEGLHLVVTYYPPRKNVYVQMLGRTARQDDKGSYAEITREKPDYYDGKVTIKEKQQALHEISEYFFSKVDQQDHENNQAKWPLLLDALFVQNKIEVDKVKKFISNHFKCKM